MKKKTLVILLVIALVLSAFAGLSLNLFSAAPENLISQQDCKNAPRLDIDAEAKSYSYFQCRKDGGSPLAYATDVQRAAGDAHGGDGFYARVPGATGASGIFKISADGTSFLAAHGAGTYTFSAWVRVPDATTTYEFYIGWANGWAGTGMKNSTGGGSSTKYDVSGSWMQITHTAYLDPATCASFRPAILAFTSASAAVTLDIDDLSMTMTAATPTPSATAETTFVGDGTELFNEGNKNYPSSSLKIGGVEQYSQVNAGEISFNNNKDKVKNDTPNSTTTNDYYYTIPSANTAWKRTYRLTNIIPATGITNDTAGKYVFSAYVRFPSLSGTSTDTVTIGSFEAISSNPWAILTEDNGTVFNVGNTWTKISAVVDIQAPADGNVLKIAIETTTSTGKLLQLDMDDISLQKAVASTTTPTETPTATPTATPAPTGDGNEYVVDGNGNGTLKLKNSGTSAYGGAVLSAESYTGDHDGNNGVYKVTPRTGNSGGMRWAFNSTESMTADGGAGEYIYSLWIKTTSDATVKVGFSKVYNGTNLDEFTIPANTWTQVTGTATLDTEKNVFGIYTTGTSAALDIYMDEISIQKVGTSSATPTATPTSTTTPTGNGNEYVVDGNGNGTLKLKNSGTSVYGGAVLSSDSYSGDHDGNNYIYKVTPRTGNSGGMRWAFNSTESMTADGGAGEYIYSLWIKTTSDATVKVGFSKVYNGTNLDEFTIPANTWTQVTGTATLDTEKNVFGIYTTGTSAALDIYMDEISIQKVGTATSTATATPTSTTTPTASDIAITPSLSLLQYVESGNNLMENGNCAGQYTPDIKVTATKGYFTYNGAKSINSDIASLKKDDTTSPDGDSKVLLIPVGTDTNPVLNQIRLRCQVGGGRLSSSTKYIFSVYAKAADSEGAGKTIKLGLSKDAAASGLKGETYTLTSAWQKLSFVLDGSDVVDASFICVVTDDPSIEVKFDSFSFKVAIPGTPTPAPTPVPEMEDLNAYEPAKANLMENGACNGQWTPNTKARSIVSGGTTTWKKSYFVYNGSTSVNSNMTSIQKTVSTHDGDNRCLLIPGTGTSNIRLRACVGSANPDDRCLEPDKLYFFSLYVKAATPADANTKISVGLSQNSTGIVDFIGKEYTLTNDWQQIVCLVRGSDLVSPLASLIVTTPSASTAFYADEFSLNIANVKDTTEYTLSKEFIASSGFDSAPTIMGKGFNYNAGWKNANGASYLYKDLVKKGTTPEGDNYYVSLPKGTPAANGAWPTSVFRLSADATSVLAAKGSGKYVLSATVRVPDGVEPTELYIGWSCGWAGTAMKNSTAPASSTKYNVNGDWVTITHEEYIDASQFSTTDANKGLRIAILAFNQGSNSVTIDVDNISFKKLLTPAEAPIYTSNLLKNGSAKTGNIDPFYTSLGKFQVKNGESVDGDGKCFIASRRRRAYSTFRYNAADIVKAYGDGLYTLTFYAKCDEATAKAKLYPSIQLCWGGDYDATKAASGKVIGQWLTGGTKQINGKEWTKFEFEFEISKMNKDLEIAQVLLYATQKDYNGYNRRPDLLFDNISFVKEVNGKERAGLIKANGTATGDTMPVVLLTAAILSVSTLFVVVTRKKRKEQ